MSIYSYLYGDPDIQMEIGRTCKFVDYLRTGVDSKEASKLWVHGLDALLPRCEDCMSIKENRT